MGKIRRIFGGNLTEIFNRKIANMVELLKAGHKYRNQEWRVGDAAERKYM